MRTNLRSEQSQLAMEALRNQDAVKSVIYQYNVVGTYDKNEFTIFENKPADFGFTSPLKLLVLRKVISSMDVKNQNIDKKIEGVERGKLAYLYEIAGLEGTAELEWAKAMELANYDDLGDFQEFIKKTIEVTQKPVE